MADPAQPGHDPRLSAMSKEELLAHTLKVQEDLSKVQEDVAPLKFTDLLVVCHKELNTINVETNLKLCSTGGVGDPHGKYIPSTVRAWPEFPGLQEAAFSKIQAIYDQCQDQIDTTYNRNSIRGLGLRQSKISSESTLRKQQSNCLEDIIRAILQDLTAKTDLSKNLRLGSAVEIVDSANELNSNQNNSGTNQGGPATGAKATGRADLIFVQKVEQGIQRLVFIVEYKPPHKLGLPLLEQGLREYDFDEISNKIINRVERKPQEDAQEQVAKVLTQVYHYMVLSGCQYAYLSTGTAFVFFHISPPDWHSLQYYMHIPAGTITADDKTQLSQTSIAQVLAFYVLACEADIVPQNEREAYMKDLSKWIPDDMKRLEQMPQTPSPSNATELSLYQPTPGRPHSPSSLSPSTRRQKRQRLRSSQSGDHATPPHRPREDDDSDDAAGGVAGPVPPTSVGSALTRASKTTGKTAAQGSQQANQGTTGSRKRIHDYCSHQCLLGLKMQGPLDPQCPNYEHHSQTISSDESKHHPIDMVQMRELLLVQVIKDMDNNIDPLGYQGSRGAAFKITLASHGYTMVGKGTPSHYIPDLRNEFAVYEHLRELQGDIIPVCLGAIDSPRNYWYDLGPVPICHWLLLSYAGNPMELEDFESPYHTAAIDALRQTLRSYNLYHGDMARRNILWEPRTQKAMVIDFERVILPRRKHRVIDKILGKRKFTTDKEESVASLTKIQPARSTTSVP
ncbi:MAG: hypothetical protein Q9219_004792 [cf. Caloplaca sp. 3 TL-2023]